MATLLAERVDNLVNDIGCTPEEAILISKPWNILQRLVELRKEGLISQDAPIGSIVTGELNRPVRLKVLDKFGIA